MALTAEEATKLNTTLEKCTEVANTTEEILTELQNGEGRAVDITTAVAAHNNSASAHSDLRTALNARVSGLSLSGNTLTVTQGSGTSNSLKLSYGTLDGIIADGCPTVDDRARAHNCFYRGKDLTNVYTLDQLSAKLNNGDFSDLYIGDYITKQFTHDGTTTNINFRFAHFNYWKYMGTIDTATPGVAVDGTTPNVIGNLTKNHILMVPDSYLFNAPMNATNTTDVPEGYEDGLGGVRGSELWRLLNSTVYTELNASNCMDGHLTGYSDWMSAGINATTPSMAGLGWNGATTVSKWCDEYVGLLSEPMVYGTTIFSSSGRDVGNKKTQLALFRLAPTWINGGASRFLWWLGAVVSASYFALAGSGGFARYNFASYVRGVRPLFLFS